MGFWYDTLQINHGWVALLYYGLAFVTAGGFYLRGVPSRTNVIARMGGVAFFIGCGLNHVDFIAHAYPRPTPMDYLAPHHWIPVVMQSVGAAIFLGVVLKNGTRGFFFAFGKEQRARGTDTVRAGDQRVLERLEQAGALSVSLTEATTVIHSTRDL